VRGAEDYNLGFLTPRHNATLPFTRNAIGSMDYTPITFSADRRETSAGHELALGVVYESGLQHPADSIESYSGYGVGEAFLQRLPAAWDETELVSGSPGEEATFARRGGDDWFVGSIVAGRARTIAVPLGFLSPGRRYVAEVVDDAGHDGLTHSRRVVTGRDRLRVAVSADGGFAAELCPAVDRSTTCLDQARLSRLRLETARRFVAPGGSVEARVTLVNQSDRTLRHASAGLVVRTAGRPASSRSRTGGRWPRERAAPRRGASARRPAPHAPPSSG
jgi:alpha-glucosidase